MNYRAYIPLGIAILIFIGSLALYGIGYSLLSKESERSSKLATQAAQKSTELERVARAHVALSTLQGDETNLDQYAITKSGVVPFLESLQATGRPLGATVNVISVADQKDGKHDRIALSLSITGTFDAVMRTLGTIEYGPYDGVITRVSFDSAGKGQWTATLTYSVGLRPSTP